ncbi:pyrolysin [Rhizoctonia solani]|nr:pyrolysin [Rhizoctonia solani]
MKLIVLCVLAAQLASATVDIKSIDRTSTARTVPNSYIVELSKGSHFKRGFTSPHEELYHDLSRRGVSWVVTREYSDSLLTGAAIKLESDADLVKVAEVASVELIAPVYLHPAPKPVFRQAMQAAANGTTPKDSFSTHVMTGVDKLHAEGFFGQGIKIGIIDSGIDYTHPSLGGAFGPGNKVIGGYDLVGDAYTGLPATPPIPDPDPLDQCDGHGTHVAGIIGADPNNPWNISGVAYESEINAYRVFGCEGSSSDDIIVDALLLAHADGNDIINLSLGGPNGWTQSFVSVVASRIAREGRIVTIAAGNEAIYGAWYASSPASGIDVIAVGSVDNTVLYHHNATVSNGRNMTYQSLNSLDIPNGLRLYATSTDVNVTADACDPLPPNTPNLSNRLVIIRRGTCPLITKIDNAAARGGRYFLIYNNVDGPVNAIITGQYPGALISQADGVFLVQQAIPRNLTVSFPNITFIIANPTGGLISEFSTYGPTYDMYLKPAITAPGGSIPSTWPVNMGAWQLASGTSMASPFVAGAAALLLQIRGKNISTSQTVRSIFQNTAIPTIRTVNTSLIPTAGQQGAGLLNVYDAVKNTGSLHPAEILLNDTEYFKGVHTLVWNEPNLGPLELFNNSATVTINPIEVTIPPGSSASVNVTIEPPVNLNATQFPVYSGYIRATGLDNSTLQSTYIGVAARLKEMKVIDNTDTYFGNVQLPVLMDALGDPIPPNGSATFTLNLEDSPLCIIRLVAGSPLIRLDLVDTSVNLKTHQYPPRYKELTHSVEGPGPHTTPLKPSGWEWLFPNRVQSTGTFGDMPTLGVLYLQRYIPRNSAADTPAEGGYYVLPINQYANGTIISDGSYRVWLRALKITGDPDQEEDYESWTSPMFVVRRA